MKKYIFILLSFCFIFSSCNKNNSNQKQKSEYDIDFTKLNYNMASSITFDMLINAKKYNLKTVKISGNFSESLHEGKRYFAVINWDSTGCCPNGLNFIPPESLVYPDDFPLENEFITVTGILKCNQNEEINFYAEKIVKE